MSSHHSPRLYDFLSVEDIDGIEKLFRNSKSGISYEELRSLLKNRSIEYSDEAFDNVCLKIDLKRDNVISWSEFISYFIVELQNDDNAMERLSIIPPIPKPAHVLTSTLRTNATRIQLMEDGRYVTIGCNAELCFWSSKWKLEITSRVDDVPNTSSPTIELSDKSRIKKSSKTLILDAVVLPDLQIICISSVSSDLRFYDVSSASKCNLRLYVRSFPTPITAFHYHSTMNDGGENSRLIFGDILGSVRVIDFMKNFKSHFRDGSLIRQVSYNELIKGEYETIRCREFIKVHEDIVRQVSFIPSLNSFISASENVITKSAYLPSVIIGNLSTEDSQIIFKMNNGTTCFAFDETSSTLATGGPNCVLYLWNIITPSQPKIIFSGHTSGIMHVFFQDDGQKVYSVDKNKVIKIWNVVEESLMQTFTGLKAVFPNDTPVTTFYNDLTREFVAAFKQIAIVKCQPRIDLNRTDGFTHMAPVSLILFNKLYEFLVTCSTSSTIIVWDVWKGRKVNLITRAHTRVEHGLVQLVEITAGCFDPNHQFLLTATDDGTLKVWNFNEGISLRTINIEHHSRVVDVFWTYEKIFVVGQSSITSFHDSNDMKGQINRGAVWNGRHQGKVVCSSIRFPDAIVTGCTEGELIFWSLETAQPYLRFNLRCLTRSSHDVYTEKLNVLKNETPLEEIHEITNNVPLQGRLHGSTTVLNLPKQQLEIPLTPQCMLSLNNRPVSATNASLLISLTSGRIQCWSHHRATECYVTDFDAIHVAGDVITSMTTDTQNCYLFTGSAMGYIKTWMIVNFCFPTSAVGVISQVKLRKIFPFLWRDDFEGRAKRSVKHQEEPLLVNSYQGHKKTISSLTFSEENQILISGSCDKSVRLWNLSGQYIGTIGSPVHWRTLSPNKPPPHNYSYRLPPDLRHAVSFTTMKVLEGGEIPPLMTRTALDMRKQEKEIEETDECDGAKPYCRILEKPVVKKDVQADALQRYEKPTLDISLPHIPVYSHLRIHPTVAINLPRTIPKCLETNNLPNLQYIFLEPDELTTE